MMKRSWREAPMMVRRPSSDAVPRRRLALAMLLAVFIAIMSGATPARAVGDPLEPLNRGIFEFNRIVDGLILRPASEIYVFAVPEPGRQGVSNFLSNLRAPVIFVNHLLQGEGDQAGVTLGRFFVNSTLGFFGVFDAASVFGVEPRRHADFGQTLGVWGVGGGAYLVLPFFGPSTFRDAGGLAVDSFFFDPFPYVSESEAQLARWGATAIDTRYQYGPLIDDIEDSSLDFYVAARSAFLQNRAAQIRKGRDIRDDSYESIFDEDFDNGFDEGAVDDELESDLDAE